MYNQTAQHHYYGGGKLIGEIVVKEGATYTQTFETAAWFRKYALIPGTYPVYRFERDRDVMFLANVPGTCTDAYLGTLWGGVAVGKDTSGPREIGKVDDCPLYVTFQYYEPNRDSVEVLTKYLSYQGGEYRQL